MKHGKKQGQKRIYRDEGDKRDKAEAKAKRGTENKSKSELTRMCRIFKIKAKSNHNRLSRLNG